MAKQSTQGDLFVISAPSGAGKTSLLQSLLSSLPNLTLSVSYTTRGCRQNEQNGVDYHFVDESTFQELIRKEVFLEYAQVFGHYYGTSRTWVEEKLKQGQDVLLEIDYQGAQQILRRYPTAISIFIIPPSKADLKARLMKRNRDDLAEIERRLTIADIEMKQADGFDYWIHNQDFSQALFDLQTVIRAQRLRQKRQSTRAIEQWLEAGKR